MKILSYEASSASKDDLHFLKMDFGTINLIVGNTGAGKTRLLNTIFNCARLVTQRDKFYLGFWDITLEHDSKKYRWIIKTDKDEEDVGKVINEQIFIYDDEKENILVDRTDEAFIFNGESLPKLSPKESSVTSTL